MKIKSTNGWITAGLVNGKRVGKPTWHYKVTYEYDAHRKQKDGKYKLFTKKASVQSEGDLAYWRVKLIITDQQLERICRRRFLLKLAKDIILHKNA